MPLSTDIALPLDRQPVFPDVCCRCLTTRPTNLYTLARRRVLWWELLFPWLWWTQPRVRREVPACDDCLPVMRRHRWLQNLAFVVAIVGALLIAVPYIDGLDLARGWGKLAWLAAAAIGAAPVVVWTVLHPLAFDLTIRERAVVYEFANADYAHRFLAENGAPSEPARDDA